MRRIREIVVPVDNCDMAARIEQWPRAISGRELSVLLDMSQSAIFGLARRGELPHYRVGNSVRFDPHATAQWLRQRQTAFPKPVADPEVLA
jgi:excisionase family DNA binding protein